MGESSSCEGVEGNNTRPLTKYIRSDAPLPPIRGLGPSRLVTMYLNDLECTYLNRVEPRAQT